MELEDMLAVTDARLSTIACLKQHNWLFLSKTQTEQVRKSSSNHSIRQKPLPQVNLDPNLLSSRAKIAIQLLLRYGDVTQVDIRFATLVDCITNCMDVTGRWR